VYIKPLYKKSNLWIHCYIIFDVLKGLLEMYKLK